jgi:LPPG:FO 2-phospho-L-lactate transferase
VLDGWLVHESDIDAVPRVEAGGIACRAVPLLMTDVETTATMVREALALAEAVRR